MNSLSYLKNSGFTHETYSTINMMGKTRNSLCVRSKMLENLRFWGLRNGHGDISKLEKFCS